MFKKLLILLVVITACDTDNSIVESNLNIIPKVNSADFKNDKFDLQSNIIFSVENDDQKELVKTFQDEFNKHLNCSVGANGDVRFETKSVLKNEAYNLLIDESGVLIQASSNPGFYYGLQSLRQLISVDILSKKDREQKTVISLPYVKISDSPRFKWRGMMLDVSRHFYTVDEVKSIIDILAMLKINTLHWHLVDDQGWRIEINKYPKLTEIGAWRVNQESLHWNKRKENSLGEKAEYGGYYTQQEIKDVVEYASSKYISIVPEIEGVAHVMSAIASYSHLSCSQEQIMVPSGGVWPITEIFCPGKESTFEFIENVLDEVVELFPSKYIHIGGDEATKTNWKKCDHCQKRIADEGLKNEEELQSYMVKRISKYLKTKGRYMIGWDEILEGGLAEGAVVMSWRGTEGGLEAASMKHNVIMSPDTYWYLDHYQGNKSEEPLAIGGYSTLNHVYSFDPIPAEMPIEDQQYVMGAQANVWTEYMPNLEHLQYMILPRMLAVSEVLWTKPENKNWDDFSERVKFMFRRLDVLGINYSKSSYNIRSEKAINPENKQLELKLFNEYKQTEIRYEIGRKLPDINSPIYTKPIKITGNTRINASVFESGNIVGSVFTDSITVFENIAKGALVSYNNTYSPKYSSGKKFGLVDGLIGSTAFDDRYWQGWFDKDVFFDVDMQQNKTISGLRLSFLVDRGNQILMSRNVKIFYSEDGENYELIKEFFPTVTEDNTKRKEILKVKELKLNARYFRVEVANSSNEDTGEKGWVFIDEFVVE